MKKQKPTLHRLAIRKTTIVPLNDAAQQQINGGQTAVICVITHQISRCTNKCIPATEVVSCRCE
ncbi:class I lanthipeptide [Taibaiella koreensis]|uniref:class I lanthipeptide n=1 Tax=Taibaiella koreensis TaxID=1268548 RepID=UPI0019693402